MSRPKKWPIGLFGYDRSDVEEAIQSQEQAYAAQVERLDAELAEATSQLEELTAIASRQRERIAQLQPTVANLESSRRRTEATLPLLGDLAQRRIRELEQQAERDRAALRDEIGRAEQDLLREQTDFRLLLERVQALAMSILPNGAADPHPVGHGPVAPGRVVPMRLIKEPLTALTAEESTPPAHSGQAWRPGMIKLDEPPAATPDAEQAGAGAAQQVAAAQATTEATTEAAAEPATEAAAEPATEAATEAATEVTTKAPTEAATEATTKAVPDAPPAELKGAGQAAFAEVAAAEMLPTEAVQPGPIAPAVAPPAATAAPPATPPAATGDPAAVALGIRAGIWHLLQGKVVGSDLRLADGTLLARAGEPITPVLVDRAQSAGLITDLILDMTFAPGGGT